MRTKDDCLMIERFVDARRTLLQWRRAKRIALQIADMQFPKTHPFRKSVQNLCRGNCEFRYQAEIAACRHADLCGDDLFKIVVDGIYMRTGPTDFFYGDTLHQVEAKDGVPEIKIPARACRDKTLNIRDVSLFYSLASHAQAFMHAVKALPTGARINSAAHRALDQNERRFLRASATMTERLKVVKIDHSQTIPVLVCLNRVGLTGDLGRVIIGFLVSMA